jgi:hypothetical protein
MQRLLASQGQNPQMNSETYRQGQGADQAYGNLLALLGVNEDRQQTNKLAATQADRGTAQTALNMARLQGMTGIGLQEGQAKQAWQQRADDRSLLNAQQRAQLAQQEALANWQRQNDVGDTNNASKTSTTTASCRSWPACCRRSSRLVVASTCRTTPLSV